MWTIFILLNLPASLVSAVSSPPAINWAQWEMFSLFEELLYDSTDSSMLFNTTARDQMHCAFLASRDPACSQIFYQPGTGICQAVGPSFLPQWLIYATGASSYMKMSCPPNWVANENSCYFFETSTQDYLSAATYCQGLGGHMMHANSPTEGAFIKSYVLTLPLGRWWAGLDDMAVEGDMRWNDDGTAMIAGSFTDLGSGQGNSPSEDCLVMYEGDDYKWHDTHCDHFNRVICEIDRI